MQSDHLLADFNQNLNVSTKKKKIPLQNYKQFHSAVLRLSPEDGWRQNTQQNKNAKDNGKRGAEKKIGNKDTRTEYGGKTE